MNKKIIFCLIVTFLLTAITTAAVTVPGDYATIEAAISIVPSAGSEIITVDDGTYTPPAPNGYDFAGKNIILQSLNGPANCIIDCQNNRRAFYFHTDETSTTAVVSGFTIKNGNEYYGGAIECEEASATIDNCIITNSAAVYGGAIDCFYASPIINNCIITQNTSSYDGGGIECSSESSPEITNCLITNNSSVNGFGGAIDCYDMSSPQILNCTIANNTGNSNYGGVYASYASNPTIRNSILWNNGNDIDGTTAVSYSCIQDGDAGTVGNISSDPLFRTGPYPSYNGYYLSQTAAGQLANSNCINAGDSSYAAIYGGVGVFTTRTNNTVDTGTVDMGFHYPDSGINNTYTLTTGVDPSGNPGTVIPVSGPYTQFSEVLLTATPTNPSDYIEKWIIDGSDVFDTNSTKLITMNANHTVMAMFSTSVCKLTTLVASGNGTIDPNYPPSGNSFPKNSQVIINAYPSDPNVYGVNRWLKGATATFDIYNPATYTETYGPDTTYTVTLGSDITVAVEFGRFMLDTRIIGENGTISPERHLQPARKTVTITATPYYGYRVKRWTDDADNKPAWNINTNTVTMTSNKLVKVEFEPVPQRTLTTNAASGATITPYYPTGHGINQNETVTLTATIPAGTAIDWSGTDNDNTLSLTNTVTMTNNKTVNVSYHTMRFLRVPGQQYPSIQSAVDDAHDGDRIIITQRAGNPYRETNIDPNGKLIHISSEHPNDPCCVAATVIDCQEAGRAFILQSNETRDTFIEGLTIINGSPTGAEPQVVWNNDSNTYIASDDALGGAIYCTNNASPTISNCVFKNCRAEGTRGANATFVWPEPRSLVAGTGIQGGDGGSGIPGGDGGHGLGGALYFGTGSDPRILHCKIIDCQAIGGNSGRGGGGGNAQDGSSGKPPLVDGIGFGGGKGGGGGGGGRGGWGGNGFGGAIYFKGQNDAIIQYCDILNCSVKPGLGNSAGSGGDGGDGGAGTGTAGKGGNGGAGGAGGDGGINGIVAAGGIYSGNDCNIQISDTTFSGNYTSIDVESFRYNPGNGGDGGSGGTGGTNGDGNGGRGGNGGHAGNAGDGYYIGDGANGGNGGNGVGQTGNGGNGGDGSAGYRPDSYGQGGQGGDGGSSGQTGQNGCDGCLSWIDFWMSNEAGSNRYGYNCTAVMTNCNFLRNHTVDDVGGAEYYEGQATAEMNNCTFSENSSAAGGAQFFGWTPNNNIDINDCTYNRNDAWYWHGGAVFAGWGVNLTVKGSTFADNVSLSTFEYGGGIHWDNYHYNKTVSITDSHFTNNMAGFGGGLNWNDGDTSTTTVTNCVFTKNSANQGGGLYWSNGSPTISGCIFKENQGNDSGGGIFSFSSDGTIKDCIITDNTSSGSGGGVYAGGNAENLKIHNCLITNNSATIDGGGLSLNWFVTSQITNCTIAENTAQGPADAGHGYGGGVSCTYESNTTMTNNILWDNNAIFGNQISLGNSNDLDYLQKPAELTVSHSDIQNWSDTNEIYIYQPDRILNIGANVIDDDPCFVQTYLLSSTPLSPCVDAGSGPASTIGLDTYTTQIDNSLDTGTVDMGYHYALNELTVVVIGHGHVDVAPNNYDPNSGTYFGNVFGLEAKPDTGYRVKSWTGADVFPGWNTNTNTVTMTGDKVVTVEFEVEYNRIIYVPGDFPGIQDAINAAENGDMIQLAAGTYVGTGFIVDRKNITILGEPAHPEAVVIDCAGEYPAFGRKGFVLVGDNYYSTTLNGLSIINSNTVNLTWLAPDEDGADGRPTKMEHDLYDSMGNYGGAITIQGRHTVKNCIIRNCSVTVNPATDGVVGDDPNKEDTPTGGYNGGDGGYGGNAGGAGIYIQWGDANITNVTIENCRAYAGRGGNGATGFENQIDYYPPGESGNGGNGGSVIGAGIYVRSGNPAFTHVTVRDCIARGGSGGNGAIGAIGADGGDGGLPGRVKGAGVYCAVTSAPTFVNCTIENCRGYGGFGGDGGGGGVYIVDEPDTEGGYGGLTTEVAAGQGDIRMYSTNGGAVFCDDRSRATFTDCKFISNMTYGSISGVGGLGQPGLWQEQPRKNFRVPSFGAGLFCSTDSSTSFTGCLFENNRTAYNQDYNDPNYFNIIDVNDINDVNDYDGEYTGVGGGLCLWSATGATIRDCNFVLNSAPIGGGIYSDLSELYISDSTLTNNVAYAGGGVLAVDSTATVISSQIKGNVAGTTSGYYSDTGYALFGTGGGIYVLDTPIYILDSIMTENYARFTGGGICFDGDTSYVEGTTMKNCLVTKNRAVEAGGGIGAIYFAEPLIQNCTIVDNFVTDINSTGGGLFCSYASETIVKDTIFWSNSGVNGSQIALSDGGPFTDMPASLTITYSDIDLRIGTDFNSPDSGSGTGGSGTTGILVDSQTIYSQINSTGTAKVIVSLVEPQEAQTTNWSSSASVSALRSAVASLQGQVLSIFDTGEFTLKNQLANVAVFSGQVTQAGLTKLLANSKVVHIEADKIAYSQLAQGVPLMNAISTRSQFNGQHVSIAISDTGVDYTHPMFGGGSFPNNKVIGGYDAGDNDTDPIPGGTTANTGHGTCCAGIAAGTLGIFNDYIGGVAYNAKIYALKISSNDFDGAWDSDTAAAWDWCITHMNDNPTYPIKVISHSFGGGSYSSAEAAENDRPALSDTARRVVEAGITILASSGNEYSTDSIAAPAAFSNVISVGAVYDAVFDSRTCGVLTRPDEVTCYSNTAEILDILASSENAYTTDIAGAGGYDSGDYFPYFNGTSAACPYAAGAVAALQSAAKQTRGEYLTPAQVRTILVMTGEPVVDTRAAITKPRVSLASAIAMLSSSVPIYTEAGCSTDGLKQDANDNWIISAGANNIFEDPNFVFGYYLSHIATDQDIDSSCIDTGSDTAAALGFDTYTTRIDGVFDADIVDIGYHYKYAVAQYDITVRILEDTNDPGIHGDITSEPNGLVPYDSNTVIYKFRFYQGQIPTLMAAADANHFVKGWYDKNDTIVSNNNTFTFTVGANVTYFVRFTEGREVSVKGGGDALKKAVEKAENYDILVVEEGIYSGNINILGKKIKLYGARPDDPNTIKKTIIDCSGGLCSGFIFNGGETADTILGSFTIINGGGPDVKGGGIFINTNSSPLIINVDINDCNALSGGGIYISSTSNPKFERVNITDCNATTNGGGVYIGTSSSPIFEDCSIADCNAGTHGGAVYCSTESSPIFTGCSFSGNSAANSGGAIFYGTSCNVKIEKCIFTNNFADYDAGAIMCDKRCEIDIYGCEIADNNSGDSGGGIFIDEDSEGRIRNTKMTGNSAFEDGGAIFITGSNAIDIGDCNNISSNTALRGGGIYAYESPEVVIYDCLINSNNAYQDNNSVGRGGGIYAFTSIEQIANCQITGNHADTSGGGIYIAGKQNNANYPLVFNCLITKNTANCDGGGISSNWLAEPLIRNCTFYDNGAVLASNSYGGGLSCAYKAKTEVINSIFWNNYATYGRAISIGSNFDAANKLSAEVTVSYSDIMDINTAIFVDPDPDNGCKLNPGAGNLAGTSLDSPYFVEGSFGNFYLMQTDTGDPCQTKDSNCVDAGSGTAINNDMYKHTTRTDHVLDIANSKVDMGYHYTLTADILGDFNFDGTVDIQDLYLFSQYWLENDCKAPFFCYERDINEDGQVDFEDFAKLAANYGLTETTPPQPDPMTWKKVPQSAGLNSITMTATKAVDRSGSPIEYYFDCNDCNDVDCNVHDSGWIPSSTYIDTGLINGQRYGYQVMARDAHGNETGWSTLAYATPGQDTSPPNPDQMEWAIGGQPVATSPTSIKMTAKTAIDDTPPVKYQFKCIEDNDANSGWQTDPNYVATGLIPETKYTFMVKASDGVGNETQYSVSAFATTLAEGTGVYTLDITIVGEGSVTIDPNQDTYAYGESVHLTATAGTGWVFDSWSGDTTGSENPKTIIMDSDKNITAKFTTVEDTTPPTYTPTANGLWVTTPYSYKVGSSYYHAMVAVAATDTESPPVSYYFKCIEGGSIDSGWRSVDVYGTAAASYTIGPFGSATWSTYRVYIKDAAGNQIVSSAWNTYYGPIE